MEIMLPISLTSAAMFGLLALWLSVRIVRLRLSQRVTHGDGGHPILARRMRAQLNFVETAPFVLALIVLLELAGHGGMWLHLVSILFVAARVLHGIGMDAEKAGAPRQIGMAMTLLTLLGLSVFAALVGFRVV